MWALHELGVRRRLVLLAIISSAIWAAGFVGVLRRSRQTSGSMTGSIRTERRGAIGTLVIDNPTRRNAMDLAMYASVPGAVATLLAHDGLRVVVLRGAGDAAFGAGSDISEFRAERTGEAARRYNATEAAAAAAIEQIPVPVLAAVHGACMGGGVGHGAVRGPPVRRRRRPLRGHAGQARRRLPARRHGPSRRGRRRGAGEGARRSPLASSTPPRPSASASSTRCSPKHELDAHVDELVSSHRRARAADAAGREARRRATPARRAAADAAHRCFSSADFLEGIDAHGEKRPPSFTGRDRR